VRLAILLLICAGIILIPFYTSGFAIGPDMVQHFRFAITYRDAFAAGDFFPGWSLDNFGFGSLGVRVYPPLLYYVAAAFYFLTGHWNTAFLAAFVGFLFLGSAGVYLFVRRSTNRNWALFAGALYAVMPYHLNQVFQQALYGEFAAAGILPFCFLFLTKSLRFRKWTDTLLFSFFFALLILTHLPSTIICSLSLAIYGACLIDRRHLARQFLQTSAALILSVALTAFYWVKVVAEREWVAHNSERFYTGYFSFAKWLFPSVLIPRELYQSFVTAVLIDTMILLTAAVLIPAVIFLFVKRKSEKSFEHRTILGLSITALAGFFLMSQLSYPLWKYLPVLQRVQFPFRWLTVFAFLTVASGALALSLLSSVFENRARMTTYPVVAFLLVMMLFNVSQIVMTSETVNDKQFEATVAELARTPGLSAWWTIWADEKAFQNSEKVTAPGRTVEVMTWSPERREFTVFEGRPTTVRISTFYYPYWKASVNGVPVEISKGENGVIELDAPPEKADIQVAFALPTSERIARFISLIGWLFLIVWTVVSKSKAKANRVDTR
jgi:uncharacterized membrane protein